MQAAIESALADLVFGPEIALGDAAGIASWLSRNGVLGADGRALSRDFPRLQLYRRLARGNLRKALEDTLPRTLFRLGALFEPYFDEFLRVMPPVSHCLRDLTPSFLSFALPRFRGDERVPAYLVDLARHEALQVEVASLLGQQKGHVAAELSLDEGVLFIDAARLVDYEWAVHRLPEDESSDVVPERLAVSLLVYRSPEHEVRYLELGAFAAGLLAGLLTCGVSLRAALDQGALRAGRPLDDELLTRAAGLLSELAGRGALLGKSPPVSPEPPIEGPRSSILP